MIQLRVYDTHSVLGVTDTFPGSLLSKPVAELSPRLTGLLRLLKPIMLQRHSFGYLPMQKGLYFERLSVVFRHCVTFCLWTQSQSFGVLSTRMKSWTNSRGGSSLMNYLLRYHNLHSSILLCSAAVASVLCSRQDRLRQPPLRLLSRILASNLRRQLLCSKDNSCRPTVEADASREEVGRCRLLHRLLHHILHDLPNQPDCPHYQPYCRTRPSILSIQELLGRLSRREELPTGLHRIRRSRCRYIYSWLCGHTFPRQCR